MDTITLTRPEPHHTESANGRAFLSYYVPEESLSFTWTGMPGHPIEVCHGGDGEPIGWRITVNALDFQREARENAAREVGLADALAEGLPATYLAPHLFQAVCDRWLDEFYANDFEATEDDDAPRVDDAACDLVGRHVSATRHRARDCDVERAAAEEDARLLRKHDGA